MKRQDLIRHVEAHDCQLFEKVASIAFTTILRTAKRQPFHVTVRLMNSLPGRFVAISEFPRPDSVVNKQIQPNREKARLKLVRIPPTLNERNDGERSTHWDRASRPCRHLLERPAGTTNQTNHTNAILDSSDS